MNTVTVKPLEWMAMGSEQWGYCGHRPIAFIHWQSDQGYTLSGPITIAPRDFPSLPAAQQVAQIEWVAFVRAAIQT